MLLRQHINGVTITATDVLTVATASDVVPGGGTANIGFLVGNGAGPNANASQLSATFWIETVETTVTVKPIAPGKKRIVKPVVPQGAPAPNVHVSSEVGTTEPRTLPVTYTQIQYSQNVSLDFVGLRWPHVSVATLAPKGPIHLNI